jgi:hypothetical protein
MKKLFLVTMVVFFGLAVVGVLHAQEEQVVLKITGLEGKVLVKIQPSNEWVDAQVGMLLKKNDEIKTLADGKAHLMLNQKTGFLLKPNSEIRVEMPIVAEPYTEPAPDRDTVYAPANVGEPAASTV